MLDPRITEALALANKALARKYGAAASLTLRPPQNMPAGRWETFICDVAAFVDNEQLTEADLLGWTALDLFGADRDRPFARIDQSGLLLLLDGHKVVGLSEDTATIETRGGARQIYRRKPGDPGRALIWELFARA
jgi:hypothetical protein